MSLFRRRRELELDEEMAFHLRSAAADRETRGEPPDLAARRARRDFGSVALVKDVTREMWGRVWLDRVVQDVRYALRQLRRSPGFAAAALLTLALGIGATTAVFSIVYGVMLRPLPYPDADRLVRIWEEQPPGVAAAGGRWLSNRTYSAWTAYPRTIRTLGGFGAREYALAVDGEVTRLFGAEVSPALLPALGARPVRGRLFTPDDAAEHAAPAVILGETLWRQRFGARADIVGRSLTIDGRPFAVVGVMTAGFDFPDRRPRFWLPYRIPPAVDPAISQGTSGFSAIGLMAPGATPAEVAAEGTAAAGSVPITIATQVLWGKGGPAVVHVRRLADDMAAPVRPALLALAGAMGLVLLIGCANVASLLLSRGLARQRELSVRAAIGASRARLVAQALTESGMLAAGGGMAGVALAWIAVPAASAKAPDFLLRLASTRIDPRVSLFQVGLDRHVLLFAATVTALTALAAGLVPALRVSSGAPSEVARGAPGTSSTAMLDRRTRGLRDGLLVLETAFAVPLLVGALLLGRSFVRLTDVDAGYDPQGVLTARIDLAGDDVSARSARLIDGLLPRLRRLPGVTAAGAGSMMPLGGMTAMTTFKLPSARTGEVQQTRTLTYVVTPGYAEALRLGLTAGRFFADRDRASGLRPMIVNDEFARQYLDGAPVIGRRLADLFSGERGTTTEIIGVVHDVLKDGNDGRPQPAIYLINGSQAGGSTREITDQINIVVRTTGRPSDLAGSVSSLVRTIDRTATFERLEPLTDTLSATVAEPRVAATVLASVALLAALLASVGLYGVLSFGVAQRRRELGVRAALGAGRRALVVLVLREGLGLTLAGVAVGLLGAALLTRLLQNLLFGVTPLDAVSFLAAPLLLLPVAALACLLPAHRAAAADPAGVLRCE